MHAKAASKQAQSMMGTTKLQAIQQAKDFGLPSDELQALMHQTLGSLFEQEATINSTTPSRPPSQMRPTTDNVLNEDEDADKDETTTRVMVDGNLLCSASAAQRIPASTKKDCSMNLLCVRSVTIQCTLTVQHLLMSLQRQCNALRAIKNSEK